MRRKLYIYDKDEIFVKRVTRGLEERGNCLYNICGFTDLEAFINSFEKDDGIFLCDESEAFNLKDKRKDLVVLSSNKNASFDIPFIYKYDGINSFFNNVILIDKEILIKKGEYIEYRQKKSELITVFSPGDLPGATKATFKICKAISKKKKVLYMNITALPTFEEENDFESKDLIELIYLSENDDKLGSETIRSCITNKDGIDCISTSAYSLEFSRVPAKNWEELIDLMISECGYEVLVIELDGSIQSAIEILRKANRAFFYLGKGGEYDCQRQRFLKYLKLREETELLNTMKILNDSEE